MTACATNARGALVMSQRHSHPVMRLAVHAGVALALAACAAVPLVERPLVVRPATLSVENLTDQSWRISFVAGGTTLPRNVEVAPRARMELELPAGEWSVDQAILNGDGQPTLTRRFPTRLEAGVSYRWPLATLRMTAADGGGG